MLREAETDSKARVPTPAISRHCRPTAGHIDPTEPRHAALGAGRLFVVDRSTINPRDRQDTPAPGGAEVRGPRAPCLVSADTDEDMSAYAKAEHIELHPESKFADRQPAVEFGARSHVDR
ncbi:hypothetical protein AB0L42_36510 [Streptomyces sp. NPDC052287]|uniref:hypothetical protein n=1 Tax=Streptomyces sp. NPDC052287 TaxID=3154950 RepID=UPI0034316EFD